MKILRWLLSHFFLILLIVVVIYGYMFWGNLAGEDTPAGKAIAYLSSEFVEVEEFVNAIKAKQANQSADKAVAGNEQAADQAASESVAVAEEAERNIPAPVNTRVEVPQVTISYSHNKTRIQQNAEGFIAIEEEREKQNTDEPLAVAVSEPVADTDTARALANSQEKADIEVQNPVQQAELEVVAVEEKPAFVPAEVEKQLNNVDRHGKVINPAQQDDRVRATWITARKSFYQRKYELSENSYRKVIESTEDNFDAYGELGNVYFNQGKKQQAAAAYYEAAAILVRKGQVQRARSLMGLLRHLDKSKASELQKLIDSTVS